MTDASERLKTAREAAGFPRAADAVERFGWSYSTYAGHENGSRGFRLDSAKRYGRAFGVLPDWLLFGSGDDEENLPVRVDPTETAPVGAKLIQAYNVQASAGFGMLVGYEEAEYTLAFPPGLMQRVTSTSPAHLAIIGVTGDSMTPDLKEDDIVMVDRTKTNIDYDGMFVIRVGEVLKVKLVNWGPGRRSVIVTSINPRYRDEEFGPEDDFEVIGRVIWTGCKV